MGYYQEFFTFNKKQIITSRGNYRTMIKKAGKKLVSGGTIVIDIESSASHVPTKTYGSNINLANKRAEAAKESVLKSLLAIKGVNKNKITFNDVKASVQGPAYNKDPYNKEYKNHQYVIIKIK